MSTPRWYRENGNIYFADIGREGSLVWIAEEEWHTDGHLDVLLEDMANMRGLFANFEWEDAK